MTWFKRLFGVGEARTQSVNERSVYQMWHGCLTEACRIQAQETGETGEDFIRQAIYAAADVVGERYGLSRSRMIGIIERHYTAA